MRVTIEGVVNTPNLQRGDTVTVQLTDSVKTLLRSGVVKVVEYPTPSVAPDLGEETVAASLRQPPPGNARREVWAKFLDDLGIVYLADAGRNELRAQFEDWVDTR